MRQSCARQTSLQPPKRTGKLLIPKELAWLSFNERVLQEADDDRNALLDRIRFLGIFSNNLDEFYRVRVARLRRFERETGASSHSRIEARGLLEEIQIQVLRQAELFNEIAGRLFQYLDQEGIHIVDERHLTEAQGRDVREYFQNQVRSRLVPIVCSRNRELLSLRDQFIYLAVELTIAERKSPVYAFVEVPTDNLSRFFILPSNGGDDHVVLLEDVIRFCLGEIFALLRPLQHRAWTVKITRDSELDIEDDTNESYVDLIHRGLRQRSKGAPVRMVYDKDLPKPFLEYLLHKMKLERQNNLIPGQRYHNFRDFIKFPDLGRKYLRQPALPPLAHPALSGYRSVFEAVTGRDLLLHYPYHGFCSFIDWLRESAIDPHVSEIYMTVYRVSPNSSVLNALSNAARNGKRVMVVLELLARFDEENNLDWVERLRDEGVRVLTGVRGLKVHAKLCLVTRRERRQIVRYAAIGTGNFNEQTAAIYTDHFLLTQDQSITAEVLHVFEFLRNNYNVAEFRHLVVSPFESRRHWSRLIHREIRNARLGRPAHIWIKLNNFADAKLIEDLYAASRAGVKIRLIVRSMHSLVPGVVGYSENIEAISIVGQYLEHGRILVFCNGGEPKVYISSGDWLPRNFDNRVEVACPIYDPTLSSELIDQFQMQWEDTVNARVWDRTLSNHRPKCATELGCKNSHQRIRAYLESKALDQAPVAAEVEQVPTVENAMMRLLRLKRSLPSVTQFGTHPGAHNEPGQLRPLGSNLLRSFAEQRLKARTARSIPLSLYPYLNGQVSRRDQ